MSLVKVPSFKKGKRKIRDGNFINQNGNNGDFYEAPSVIQHDFTSS